MTLPFVKLWWRSLKSTTARLGREGAGRVAFLAAVAAFVVHLGWIPGLQPGIWSHEAINYDDPQVLEAVETTSAIEMLTGTTYYAYKPFYFLSLKVDAWVGGLFGDGGAVTLGLFVNLFLFVLCTALLVWLVMHVFARPFVALTVGLLFAVHPLHVENVAWLSERKDTLSLAFVLWAHLSFRMRREDGRGLLVPALWLLCGGLTKGTVWTYAGVIAVDAWMHRVPQEGARLGTWMRQVAPLALVAIGGVILDWTLAVAAGPAGVDHGVSTGSLAAAMAGVHARYVASLFFPAHLALDYGIDPAGSWGAPATWMGLALAVVWVGLLVWSLRRRSWVGGLAAALWIFGLAPVNNVLPTTAILMADRYMLIPAIGVYLLLAFGLAKLGSWRTPVVGALVLVLGVLAMVRTHAFGSSERIWSDTVAKHPESAVAWIQRAQDRAVRQAYEGALQDVKAAVQLKPRPELLVRARLVRLAAMLGTLDRGPAEEAERRVQDLRFEAQNVLELLASLPENEVVRAERDRARSEAEVFLGNAYDALGLPGVALDTFREAVHHDPESGVARYNYGTALGRLNEQDALEDSILELRRALPRLEGTPTHELALIQLATVHGRMGNATEALRILRDASERYPNSAEILYAEARIRLRVQGEVDRAQEILATIKAMDEAHPKAARLQADLFQAEGKAYLRKYQEAPAAGRDEELLKRALHKFDQAAAAEPKYWEAHVAAGDAFFERALFPEARERYARALRVDGRQRWVRQLIARSHVLDAAWMDRYGELESTRARAAEQMRKGLALDVARIDLGFTPLTDMLAVLREVAEVYDTDRDPVNQLHARQTLVAAAQLCAGGDERALRLVTDVMAARSEATKPAILLDTCYILRGMLHERFTELDDARRSYEAAAKRRLEDPVVRLRQLQLAQRMARVRLRTAQGYPEDKEGLERASQRWARALEDVRQFADAHPESVDAGLAAAEAELSEARWTGALRRLNRLANEYPDRPSIYRGRAAIYVAQRLAGGDATLGHQYITQASRQLQVALQLDPRDVRTHLDASGVARTAGDLGSALRHAREAWKLEKMPGGPASQALSGLLLAMGRQALDARELEQVKKFVLEARKVAPQSAGPWLLDAERVLAMPSKSRLVDAEELANKAAALEPLDTDVQNVLGKIYEEMGSVANVRMAAVRAPRAPWKNERYEDDPTWKDGLTPEQQNEKVRAWETAKRRAETQQAALRHTAMRYLDSALDLLDPDSEEAERVKTRLSGLRESDPTARLQDQRRAHQEVFPRAEDERGRGRIVAALEAYLEATALDSQYAKAHVRVVEMALRLLEAWDWNGQENARRGSRYVNLAFQSLHALAQIDEIGRLLEVHIHRGDLNAHLYKAGRAGAEARAAARRAYEEYIEVAGVWVAGELAKDPYPDLSTWPDDQPIPPREGYRAPANRIEFRQAQIEQTKQRLRRLGP